MPEFEPYEREPEDQDATAMLQHVLRAMESEGIDSQMLMDSFSDSLAGIPEEDDGKALSDDEDDDDLDEDDDESSDEATRVDSDDKEIANR